MFNLIYCFYSWEWEKHSWVQTMESKKLRSVLSIKQVFWLFCFFFLLDSLCYDENQRKNSSNGDINNKRFFFLMIICCCWSDFFFLFGVNRALRYVCFGSTKRVLKISFSVKVNLFLFFFAFSDNSFFKIKKEKKSLSVEN